MDIAVILQIATVGISMLTLVATYVTNAILNKKNRTVSSIANERVNKLFQFRMAYGKLVAMCNDRYIRNKVKGNKETNLDYNETYCYVLNKNVAICRTNLASLKEQERRIIKLMDELVKLASEYYFTLNKDIIKPMTKIRNEFYIECSLYDWAVWKFVIKQADGNKHIGSEFDRVYDDVLTRVRKFHGSDDDIFKLFDEIYRQHCEEILKRNNIDISLENYKYSDYTFDTEGLYKHKNVSQKVKRDKQVDRNKKNKISKKQRSVNSVRNENVAEEGDN